VAGGGATGATVPTAGVHCPATAAVVVVAAAV
jgi:hypothetical protein